MAQNRLSYLALGDSYTIGESVKVEERWPEILANLLTRQGVEVSVEKIIATTGWTTNELLEAVNKEENGTGYEVVSLLIGVNNQYRGYGIMQYKAEFEELLKKSIAFANKKVDRVFVVSIPDYGVTPFAEKENKNIGRIQKELEEYNRVARNICEKYGVAFYDITPISIQAVWDEEMIASDGLHPSGLMYKKWAEYIAADLYRKIKE